MERKREAKNNARLYIAVSCCVAVLAIIGYVSWFADWGNNPPEDNIIKENAVEVPKLSDGIKLPVNQKAPVSPKTEKVYQKDTPVAKNVIAEENIPSFKKPIESKIICDFSDGRLLYCEPLADWRSHNGIDLEAKQGDEVLASADGVVEKVFSDSMGNCVLIDHENGMKTLYANLENKDDSLVGKNVKQGDKIGNVGNSALADFKNGYHLHFEILKDDKPQNPKDYLK